MKLGKCVILWSMLLTGYDKGQLRFIIKSLKLIESYYFFIQFFENEENNCHKFVHLI